MTEFLGTEGGQIVDEVTGLTAAVEAVVAVRPELVWDLAADLEAVEPGRPPAVQDTRHADLIPGRPAGGAHSSSSQRPDGVIVKRASPSAAIAVSCRWCVSFTGHGMSGRWGRASPEGALIRWNLRRRGQPLH